MPDENNHEPAESKRERREQDLESARLWQQVLREELRHRKDFRTLFERHEAIYGQKVRQLRTERGWTQAQLAERLNELGWPIHQTTVAKLEAGARPIRIAEADALAVAFGLPMEALWYMPVQGEPWSIARMKSELEHVEDFMRVLVDQLRSTVVTYAEQQIERMRLVQAMNEVAIAASRGEVEHLDLTAEETQALVDGLADRNRDEILAAMTPERRAAVTHETHERLMAGEPQRLAAELWQRYSAGEDTESVTRFLAERMPSEVQDALAAAAEILRESLGWPEPPAKGQGRQRPEVH